MSWPRTNAEATKVERQRNLDQYGQPSYEVVHTHVRVWLEIAHVMERNIDGEFGRVDGFLIVSAEAELKIGDILTISNEAYEVVQREVHLGADKRPRTIECSIVKQAR